jgi:hypothetical protein
MKLNITGTFLFLFLFSTVFAQKKELKSITGFELKAHLEFIASDNMQGRDFGTPIPGLQITADYLKSQSLKMGLKPGLPNFTQTVKMVSVQTEKENTFLKLKNLNGEVVYKSNDILTFPGSVKNDTIDARIVFAGYGYQNDDIGYNDFEGLDLTGKMVMVMTRNRELAIDTAKADDNSRMEMAKLGRIFLSGAKGIIFVSDPINPDKSWFEMVKDYASQGKYQLNESEEFELPGNIILVNTEIANAILKESGKTLEEIQLEINKTGKPNSFELENVTAEIQLVKKAETMLPVKILLQLLKAVIRF